MKLENEIDLRRWARIALPEALFIEPSMGGTDGVPDMFYCHEGKSMWLELKVGRAKGNEVKYKIRPRQRKVIEYLMKHGQSVVILMLVPTFGVFAFDPKINPLGGSILFSRMRRVDNLSALELPYTRGQCKVVIKRHLGKTEKKGLKS